MSLSPPPPPSDEGRRRLRAIRVLHTASAWFAGRFAEFAADAEEAIARAAEEDPVRERPLLDALARFRAQRAAVEHALLAALAERIARLAGQSPPRRPRAPLQLLADEDLAIALAIAPLTRQARKLASAEWGLLEACLAQLFDPPPDDGVWPLDPAGVIAAFREATESLGDFDRDALLILLDRFGACVLARLPELYRELLLAFATAGLIARGQRRESTPATGPAARSGAGPTIWRRLEQRLASGAPDGPEPREDAPTSELLHALSLLQNLPQADRRGDGSSGALKALVLERLAGLRGGRPPRLSPRDERGIDLVGLLFDFILRDQAIPERIRLILARLQIPCVKAVLIEGNSLAERDGAPRRLLDALAEAAVGWSEEADRDGRLLAEIEAAVDTVVREFDEDLAVFERALQAFQRFEASERQRAEAAAQRHLAAMRGRERLRLVRAEVGARIAALVGERPLPPTLRHLIFGPWANYLVLTMLRHGEESPALREALGLAERLVAVAWGMRERPLGEELARIEALLRHGLHAVAVHDREVEALMGWLSRFLGAPGLASPPPEIPPLPEPSPLAPPFVSDTGREASGPPPADMVAGEGEDPPVGSWWRFR